MCVRARCVSVYMCARACFYCLTGPLSRRKSSSRRVYPAVYQPNMPSISRIATAPDHGFMRCVAILTLQQGNKVSSVRMLVINAQSTPRIEKTLFIPLRQIAVSARTLKAHKGKNCCGNIMANQKHEIRANHKFNGPHYVKTQLLHPSKQTQHYQSWRPGIPHYVKTQLLHTHKQTQNYPSCRSGKEEKNSTKPFVSSVASAGTERE